MDVPIQQPWAATKIVTFKTILTVASSQKSVTINYPWPARTSAAEFTTITRLATVIPKQKADQPLNHPQQLETIILPILVLTNVEAAVVDTSGRTIKHATLTQPAPSYIGTPVTGGLSESPTSINTVPVNDKCNTGFGCWTKAQQIGTIIAIAVVGSGIVWLIFSIFRRCRVPVRVHARATHQDSSLEDAECGRSARPNVQFFNVSGSNTEARSHCNTIVSVKSNGWKRVGTIGLWRKKHLLRPKTESKTEPSASNGQCGQHANAELSHVPSAIAPIVESATPQIERTQEHNRGGATPQITFNIKRRNSTDEKMQRDKVKVLGRPTAIVPVIDTSPEYQARIRAERKKRTRQANIAIALAAAEAEVKRRREQREYNAGHQNRRRGELTRSEASEIYAKTGDRLRKESPSGKFVNDLKLDQSESDSWLEGQEKAPIKIHTERRASLVNRRSTRRSKERDVAYEKRRSSISNIQNEIGEEKELREPKERGDMLAFKLPERSRSSRSRHNEMGRRRMSPKPRKSKGLLQRASDLSTIQNDDKLGIISQDPSTSTSARYGDDKSSQQKKSLPSRQHHRNSKQGDEKRPSKLWALLPIALQANNTLAEPDGSWEQYHKTNNVSKRNSSQRVERPNHLLSEQHGTDHSIKNTYGVDIKHDSKDVGFSRENKRRHAHTRRATINADTELGGGNQAKEVTSRRLVAENIKPQETQIKKQHTHASKVISHKDKETKHSPLKDVPGPPPTVEAPTPSRRKHVRVVNRGFEQVSRPRFDSPARRTKEKSRSRIRNDSVPRRHSWDDDGNESMEEREWDDIVSSLG